MMLARSIFQPLLHSQVSVRFFRATPVVGGFRRPRYCAVRCDSTRFGGQGKKSPARMAEVHRPFYEDAGSTGAEPIPQITLDHVNVRYARSSGPGGQNVNKSNTKVDMRFNVQNAHWLNERVRAKIMLTEKNRINKDGDIVISSTKTRTQKGNIKDALAKYQAIIDAAHYVPPPPSEEKVKKIARLSSAAEQRRLVNKKSVSKKKSFRRSRAGWD